jgi:hypothetical protein
VWEQSASAAAEEDMDDKAAAVESSIVMSGTASCALERFEACVESWERMTRWDCG